MHKTPSKLPQIPLDEPIPLGPFNLFEVIGRGGMGEVWRAVHREEQYPVAVKVVTSARGRKDHFLEAFRREVQTVAGLDHPNITMVLDYGQVSHEAETRSKGRLTAGSPFLAMELANQGSLREALWHKTLTWSAVRRLLLSVLEGLAHAHARGVIHRDIKPDNVLRSAPHSDPSESSLEHAVWKLTDFGIAHALDQFRSGSVEQSSGTPSYMAPEQIVGRWRDYGPWTDLYALGCLAHRMVSGRVPFEGRTTREVADGHLWKPLGAIEPIIHVPTGFIGWISRLLMKDPHNRYQFAADAAFALAAFPESLPDPVPLPIRTQHPSGASSQRRTLVPDAQVADVQAHEALPNKVPAVPAARRLHFRPRREPTNPEPTHHTTQKTPIPPPDLARSSPSQGVHDAPTRQIADPLSSPRVPARSNTPPSSEHLRDHNKTRPHGLRPGFIETASHPVQTPPLPYVRPPCPEDWRDQTPSRPPALLGAGLSLYSLRSIPLVGRDEERDTLWSTFREVSQQRSPKTLFLQGSAGAGKSRLADWLCERAHETGSAHIFRCTHSAQPGHVDGFEWMVARFFRCAGLSRPETLEHLARLFRNWGVETSWSWRAFTELILGHEGLHDLDSMDGDEHIRLLSTPSERIGLLFNLFRWITKRRPIILVVEDAQWATEVLDFVRLIQKNCRKRPCSVLTLITIQEEALYENPRTARILTEIREESYAPTIRLRPLSETHMASLVGKLLDLENSLTVQVAQRAAGNPMFAIQIVGDWISRDLLQHGRDGFTLRDDIQATLPDDLHRIWFDRVSRLLENRSEDDRRALELAAVLGHEIVWREWRNASSRLGIQPSPSLASTLVARRFAKWTSNTNWAFAHGMLRESLERIASEDDRVTAYHQACAEMLTDLHSPPFDLQTHERLAHHFTHCDLPQHALPSLLAAANFRIERSEYELALIHLNQHDRVLEHLDSEPHILSRIQSLLLQSNALRSLTLFEKSRACALQAEHEAERIARKKLQAKAILSQAQTAFSIGQLERSQSLHTRASELFQEVGSQVGLAETDVSLANVLIRRGHLDLAQQHYSSALKAFEATQHPRDAIRARQGLAEIAWIRGDLDSAQLLYQKTLLQSEALDARNFLITSLNGLAEVDRKHGRYEAAAARYKRVRSLAESMGMRQTWIIDLNIGFALLAQRRFDEARQLIEPLIPELEDSGRGAILGGIHAELLPCVAAADDWTAYDHHMNMSKILLSLAGVADPDDAWPAELAGDIAAQKGMPLRAERAYNLALQLRRTLKQTQQITALEEKISALDFSFRE